LQFSKRIEVAALMDTLNSKWKCLLRLLLRRDEATIRTTTRGDQHLSRRLRPRLRSKKIKKETKENSPIQTRISFVWTMRHFALPQTKHEDLRGVKRRKRDDPAQSGKFCSQEVKHCPQEIPRNPPKQ
jgi:hypothetical protein